MEPGERRHGYLYVVDDYILTVIYRSSEPDFKGMICRVYTQILFM